MTSASSPVSDAIAAIDLGSNSFHLVVARPQGGDLQVIDRLRDSVRLAAGMGSDDRLAPEALERALECLKRFGERLRHMPAGTVRAVGTYTLRLATNGDEFLTVAERALGHPIEIISGMEEARLIYQGVSHTLPETGRRQLVVDIGGGSTEFIIGERHEPLKMESTAMGCVTMSELHFPGGELTAAGAERARVAALMQLEPYESAFRDIGWDEAVGASGTLRTIERVIRESAWGEDGITLTALHRLLEALLKAGHVDKLKLPGLSEKRKPIFPGGLAILMAAFESLGIERMRIAEGALREGVLYDLLGRLRHEDVRGRAVAALGARFGVDAMQALRVERTALALLLQAAAAWDLDLDNARPWLCWAAQLHEVGLGIAHNGYHKHGAYILENADLQGFSRQEQMMLAALVRSHRRKFPVAWFKKLSGGASEMALHLSVLLRIAATLHRSRHAAPLPPVQLNAQGDLLQLRFPEGWFDSHPLTRADLEQEGEFLKAAGIKLEIA
jgi:exopolyphosphatase/guanosine-5'-triphosphate,3'-diphosphate pyrophosphatase